MPSLEHEGMVALFENRPRLVAELLASTQRRALPPFTRASVESSNLTQLDPVAYRAPDLEALYLSLIDRGLDPEASQRLEELMTALGEQQLGYFERKALDAREKGREEGREEGQRQAQLANLLQVLQLRFGQLPKRVSERLASAALDELEDTFTRALTAQTLDDVFPDSG